MYAIVEIAGQQFRVSEKDRLRVPLLDVESGKKVEFDKVLLFHDAKDKVTVGTPTVPKVKVTATVVEHGRDKKIIVFKKKRRKGYQKKNGHRQHFSLIEITKIGTAGRAKKAAPKAEKTEETKEA